MFFIPEVWFVCFVWFWILMYYYTAYFENGGNRRITSSRLGSSFR
jgi:hypothetical protein